MADYLHHVPGRLRIKSPLLKRNHSIAQTIQVNLKNIKGVISSDVNPLTGSVLVKYNPKEIQLNHVLEELASHGVEVAAEMLHKAEDALTQSLSKVGGKVSKVAAGMVVEKIIERSAAAIVSAIL